MIVHVHGKEKFTLLEILLYLIMKHCRASSIYTTNLIPYSSRGWFFPSTKVSRKYGSHYQARSFSVIAIDTSSKRYSQFRATTSALSPCSAGSRIIRTSLPLAMTRFISNQAKSSAFSPSPQSTTINATPNSQGKKYNPLINPLSITLPPPLHIPERKANQSNVSYLYSQGRAYLNFFKSGLGNIWTMRKNAQEIKAKKAKQDGSQQTFLPLITRAEYQLLQRNEAALSKVIPFGLFIFIFAELSPILLVFITGLVPEPCQLPSVQAKIEQKYNERKFKSFIRYKEYLETTEKGKGDKRMLQAGSAGAGAVSSSSSSSSTPQQQVLEPSPAHSLLTTLSTPTLHHASTAIKAHPAILDRLSYIPLLSYVSSLILTRNYFINHIRKRLDYLRTDDALLLRDGSIEGLSPQELKRAVSERGYLAEPSLGVSDGMRVKQMKEWLGGSSVSKDEKVGENGENGLLKLILDG